MNYWDRQYRLTVGDVVIDSRESDKPLQLSFSVNINQGNTVTLASIAVANLAPSTKAKMTERNLPVTFECGYAENFGEVFSGVLNFAEEDTSRRPDLYTVFWCHSNLDRIRDAVADLSFGDGTPWLDVITDTALKINGNVKTFGNFPADEKVLFGYKTRKGAREELDYLAKEHGFKWIDYYSELVIVKDGFTVPDRVYEFSPSSGLVGNVKIGHEGIHADVLMTPGLKINTSVILKPASFTLNVDNPFFNVVLPYISDSGEYTIRDITHSGDFYDGEWITSIRTMPFGEANEE